MYEAAFAMKIVKSEKCLFDDPFSDGQHESSATIWLQLANSSKICPENVGYETDVGTMVAVGDKHIV